MPFLDQFDVVLLDLNGTFMFEHDRFGPNEDYYTTYRGFGGERLSRDALMTAMTECHAGLLRDYETPSRFDNFLTLTEAFREYGLAPKEELDLLERVFAAHELGLVPPSYIACLRGIAATHQLGVVSNICARPSPWLTYFDGVGLLPFFSCTVFSSEGRSIKPSPQLFRKALSAFPSGARVLFAGDSLERDILPARALGMATAWIAPPGSSAVAADVTIGSLPELASGTSFN